MKLVECGNASQRLSMLRKRIAAIDDGINKLAEKRSQLQSKTSLLCAEVQVLQLPVEQRTYLLTACLDRR